MLSQSLHFWQCKCFLFWTCIHKLSTLTNQIKVLFSRQAESYAHTEHSWECRVAEEVGGEGGIFPTGSPIYQENRVLGSTKFYDTSKSTVLSQLKQAYQCLENNNDSCTGMKQPLTLNNEFILHGFDLTTSIWQSRHSNKLNTHPLKPWCSFPQNSNTVLDWLQLTLSM